MSQRFARLAKNSARKPTKQSAKNPAKGLSAHEEMLLARAETALEDLGGDYQATVQKQFLEICAHVADQRWLDASHIAHSIHGEAGSFHRPDMARVAAMLRDILMAPNPASLMQSIEVLQDGLTFFINLDVETNCDTTNKLLEGLVTVAAKSGIEVSS